MRRQPLLPENVSDELLGTLRNLVAQVKFFDTPVVKKEQSIHELPEGRKMIYDSGGGPAIYMRCGGKLYRQPMTELNEQTLEPVDNE